VGVGSPTDTPWRYAVSATMGASMRFTIYPDVGSVRWGTEQRSVL
jgi:hypothetical protein